MPLLLLDDLLRRRLDVAEYPARRSLPPRRVKAEIEFKNPIKQRARGMRAQRVQEFLTLNGFSVSIDADFGPATKRRVEDFQAARGLATTGVVDFKTHVELVAPVVRALKPISTRGRNLSSLTSAYAKQHIKQSAREVGGNNRGPWVRIYLGWDGPGALWCAGFVCFALEQAGHTLGEKPPIKSSSSCDVLANEAKRANVFVSETRVRSGKFPKSELVPGSFFLIRRVPGDWFHVGIVTEAAKDSFDTAEGNTDSGGSSNGYEAAERTRNYRAKDFIVW